MGNMQERSILFCLRGVLVKLIIVILLIKTLMVTSVPATRTTDDDPNLVLLEQLPKGTVTPPGHSGCSHFSSPGGGGDCPSKAASMESSAYPNYHRVSLGVADPGAPPPSDTENTRKFEAQ